MKWLCKILIFFFLLLPTHALAGQAAEEPITTVEEEINLVQVLMDGSIKDFLVADKRIQLCVISLWIARTRKSDQEFIYFVERMGLQKFKVACNDILKEIKVATKGVKNIDDIPAMSFFLMCGNNLSKKYTWLAVK